MSEPTEQLGPTPIQLYAMPDRGRPMIPADPRSYDAQWVRREDFERVQRELIHERAAREVIEKALREIEIECGNPDPSDGEGIDPQDVVGTVLQQCAAREAAVIDRDNWKTACATANQQIQDVASMCETAEAKLAELQKASLALYDFCLSHISAVQDIPDEVWIPFKEAVNSPRQAIDAAMKS